MKFIGMGIVLVVLISLLIGCGVPQENYDSLVAERDTAKAQVVSVQGDLDKAKAQIASVQGDLDKAKAQVVSTQSDLDKSKAQAVSTQGDLDKAKVQVTSMQNDLSNTNTKYSDLVSSTTKQIDALKRLTILKTVFCSAKPNANSYTVKPDNTYKVGESVWVYAEVIGIKYDVVVPKLRLNFQTEFKVLNDKGELANSWITTNSDELDRPFSYYWYSKEYSTLKVGDYTLEITFQDKLSGETATWKGAFKVTA